MNKEKQKNLKTLSKIVYILAKIAKACMVIGVVLLVLTMFIVPAIFKYIKIDDNTITVDKETYNYEIKDNHMVITDKDGKESNFDVYIDADIKEYIEKNDTNDYVLHIEILLIASIITIIISYLIADSLEKLFININEDNPFTEENTNYLRKIAKYSLYSLIISIILQIVFDLVSGLEINIDFSSVSIMTVLILYTSTYIFEYGTKLQEKSNEKIYSE